MRPWPVWIMLSACSGWGDKDAVETGGWGAEDCAWTPAASGEVAVREECLGSEPTAVEDPWNIAPEWSYTDPGGGIWVMPAVGSVTDDNGDGLADLRDTPDIVAATRGFTLVLLDGATGAVHWELDAFVADAGVIIADVDADGTNEIVAMNLGRQLQAIDGAGDVEWTSEPLAASELAQPVVADLDGDGVPEIVVEGAVLSGEDGSIRVTLDDTTATYSSPVVADLDLDGSMEIILGEHVFDREGELLWRGDVGSSTNLAAVLNADEDDEAEVLMVSGRTSAIYEHDGTLKTELTALDGLVASQPCVADLDGDGAPEIGVPTSDALLVFEATGEVLWEYPTDDFSGLAGCSAFDFDLDGAYELLYADEGDFYIFEGGTGELIYQDSDHASGTLFEYPVVADVDDDGSAEVVVASNGGDINGLRVYGQVNNRWPSAGPGWPTHDYGGANVLSDGTVIPNPVPSWLGDNLFHARTSTEDGSRADLSVEITDICVTACVGGELVVGVQVSNQGGADAPAGVPLTIYAVSGAEAIAVQTIALGEAIPSGAAATGVSFTVAPSYFGPEGFRVRLDDDGAGHTSVSDCDRSNNEVSYNEPVCGTY